MFCCFRKMYLNCCVIIDCIEVYIEIFIVFDIVVVLWFDYKQYYIFKFLVVIILRGVVFWVFFVYGGCVFDVYIVWDSGFLNNI